MDDKELAKMSGQAREQGVAAYKLNEIKMSGDSGEFSLREILGEKNAEGHYPTLELGKQVSGVILKMRWRLFRYEENKQSLMTSEYDFKNKDTVVVFGSGEKGVAAEMKEKYQLGTQRVLYVYFPGRKEVCRVIVKSSALTGEKNTDGSMGLFEYVDSFDMGKDEYLHNYQTVFKGTYREDPKNPRKSYWAMTFSRGPEVATENKDKIGEMIQEVHKRLGVNFAEEYEAPKEEIAYPSDEPNPDDIPW